jgi:hypothetical protein
VAQIPKWVASTLLVAAASTALPPVAAAEPVDPVAGSESAQAVIDDLSAQGYNVEINWVSGVSSVPLSQCSVNGIHNPDHSVGPPTTFTTVYVDVSCPNHDDGDRFVLEVGVGIG